MAQSIPPGDLTTQPNAKIVFNAPFNDKQIHYIEVSNAGARRIGWALATTNSNRLEVDPPWGVSDPNEPVLVSVTCYAFDADEEDTNNDCIVIEWQNTPRGASLCFRPEWLDGDRIVRRRKNLAIEYNR